MNLVIIDPNIAKKPAKIEIYMVLRNSYFYLVHNEAGEVIHSKKIEAPSKEDAINDLKKIYGIKELV